MGRLSGYEAVDSQSTERAQFLSEQLAQLGADPFSRSYYSASLDMLNITPGGNHLEICAGKCPDLEDLAKRLDGEGRITLVDSSSQLLGELRERVQALQKQHPDLKIDLNHQDACDLNTDVSGFHTCRIVRGLMHIEEQGLAVSKASEQLLERGRLLLLEPDWTGIEIRDHQDETDTDNINSDNRIVTCIIQKLIEDVCDGYIGLELQFLPIESDLEVQDRRKMIRVVSEFQQAIDFYEFPKLLNSAVEEGRLTETEASAWIAANQDNQDFRMWLTFNLVLAEKSSVSATIS